MSVHISARVRVPARSVDPLVKHYHWLDFQMGLFDAYEAGADTVALVDLDATWRKARASTSSRTRGAGS